MGAGRLTPGDVERLIEELRADGLRVEAAACRDQPFGSWYVVVRGPAARVRVVFDGRDGTLCYERWRGGRHRLLGGRGRGWWEVLEVLDPATADPAAWAAESVRERAGRHAAGRHAAGRQPPR